MLHVTCPPEHRVVEEGELHLRVVLQRGPAAGRRHVDVGHVQRHLHRQEGLGRVSHLTHTWGHSFSFRAKKNAIFKKYYFTKRILIMK